MAKIARLIGRVTLYWLVILLLFRFLNFWQILAAVLLLCAGRLVLRFWDPTGFLNRAQVWKRYVVVAVLNLCIIGTDLITAVINDTWDLFKVFATWLRVWFPKQSTPIKLTVVISASVVIAWFIFVLVYSPEPDFELVGNENPPCVLGSSRVTMTQAELDERVRRIIDTRTFWILRDDEAVPGVERVLAVRSIVERAAKENGINPDDLESILFIESQGRNEVKSPTGPIGIAQLTEETAKNVGLRVVWKEEVVRRRVGKKIIKDVVRTKIIDDRLDPELAIPAAARVLRQAIDFYGRVDFAIADYHTGRPKIRNLIKIYLSPKEVTTCGKTDLKKYNLTYSDLYFRCSPYFNPGAYAEILRLMREVDSGPNYFFKIECAKKVFALRRADKSAFLKLAERQRFEGRRAANRMWTFYTDNDEAIISTDDLKSWIKNGKLVPIPNKPEFGFTIRTEGKGAVAELDLENQKDYMASKPETAGSLLYIASKLQELRMGKKMLMLEVTSITRTVEYQKRLSRYNPVATKKMSFHVLGLAFDITKRGLSEQDLRDIQFILEELDSAGLISWVSENDAFHVVVAPTSEAISFFTGIYRETKNFRLKF